MTSLPQPPPALAVGIVCPECGYDLRGSTSTRCPECGYALDDLRAGRTALPWPNRAVLGRWRAFWATAWLVMRRPLRVTAEAAIPVDEPSARRFTLIAQLLAHAAALTALAIIALQSTASMRLPIAGVAVWWLVFVQMLPALGRQFVRSGRLTPHVENRAAALAGYAWAPLAWLPLVMGVLALGGALARPWWRHTSADIWLFTLALLAPPSALAWSQALVLGLTARIAHFGFWTRVWRMGLLLLANLLVAVVPLLVAAAVLYLFVIANSLR